MNKELDEYLEVAADHMEELFGLQQAFTLAWELAEKLMKRWEAAEVIPRQPPTEEAQRLLSNFIVQKLSKEITACHDTAMAAHAYQEYVLKYWEDQK